MPDYKMDRIKQFLVEKIDLIIFCDYLLDKIQEIRNIRPSDLEYRALAGNNLKQKVISLISEIVRLGWIADFIFILTKFWLENGGKKKEICDAGIHEDLCIAAQELWRENELRELAKDAFNLLSELDKDFRPEWQKAERGAMLKNVDKLEPYMDIEKFIELLAKSSELYENVINHLENHRLLDARNSYIEMEELLPGYGCRENIPFVVRLINIEEIHRLQNVDLCRAGQELWRENELRELAIEAFNRLSELDKGFRQEWQKTKKGMVLKNVINMGSNKSIEELIALLVKCREQYENAVKYIKDHRLIDAREAFIELDKLLSGYGDRSDGVECLKNEHDVRKLQTVIDAAQSGLVYDGQLPRETENPYRLYQELGAPITPSSSMENVQEELQKLKNQEDGISDETCVILETLVKNTDERLFVDAFLYPVCPLEKSVLSLINTYFQESQLPSPETIKKKYPNDAALLLFLMGRPLDAASTWKKSLIKQPLDGLPAHCMGLLYLGLAYSNENTGLEQRVGYWRSAIAHWAMVLANTVYWIKWARERFNNYKAPFVFAAIDTLVSKVRCYLRDLLDKNLEADINMATYRKELKKQLDIEFEAVHLSNALGGIEMGQGLSAWLGPLWMADYKLENNVADHLANFAPDPRMEYSLLGQLSPEEALRRLRWYFSYLSIPAILVEGPEPNPGEALNILKSPVNHQDQNCSDPNCPVHGEQQYPVLVYCTSGNQFQMENPAYKAQKEAGKLMGEDALQLAIAAHSHLAKELIRDLELNEPKKLKEHWQNILELANHSQNPKIIREGLRSMVMEETNPIPKDMARIGAAITIIEDCLNVLAENYEKLNNEDQVEESLKDIALKTRLAELLTSRGMKKFELQEITGAEVDLTRALDFAPHKPLSRIQLVMLWVNQAILYIRSERFLAQDYLRQAEELIEKGQEEYKDYDYGEFKTWLHQLKMKFFHRPIDSGANGISTASVPPLEPEKQPPHRRETSTKAWLYSQGIRELRDGRPDTALNTFEQALEQAPDDIDIQKEIPRALMEHAMQLTGENRHQEALNQVEGWIGRLPNQRKRMERQLEFLKGWLYIQPWLEVPKDFDFQIYDYQEVRLIFPEQSVENEFSWVRVQVEGDYISMRALMPLLSDTEREKGLLNLLQATNNIMFKLSYSDKPELVLKCLVPFRLFDPLRLLNPVRLLDPGWFSQTALDLFKFSDISGKRIIMIDTLQAYFREIEATSLQRHSNHHLPESTSALIKVCKKRKLPYERMTDVYYKMDNGRIEMKAQNNGTRLFTSLGTLQETSKPYTMLEKLVKYNTTLKQCKLALDDNMNVILSIEWPYLDEPAVSEALDLLKQETAELTPKLT